MQVYIDYITGRQFLFDLNFGNLTGSGTANQIAYFTGANSVGSLSTTIYPSLTELSYLKGVTSAIQTQLDGKQDDLNGIGFVKINGTTISYDNSTYLTAISVGSINSQVKSANGLVVVGSTIIAQTADASNVGMVSTGAQTFAGAKTFSNDAFSSVVISSNAYTGNNGSHFIINPNITNNNASGSVAIQTISGTISAGANNALHIGLNLNTTYNAGAFTGTLFYDLQFSRNNPLINYSSGGLTFRSAGTSNFVLTSGAGGFLSTKGKLGGVTGSPVNALDVAGDSYFGGSTTAPTASARVHIVGANATTGSAFIVTNSTPTTIIRADNNLDLYLGASTGKIGLFSVTPIVRPVTGGASATIASPGAGNTIKTDDTFDGYTLAQVVRALRLLGALT